MNIKQKKFYIMGIALIILFLLWFVSNRIPVEAYKIQPEDAIKGVAVTGTVKSTEDVLVAPTNTGIIDKFYIKEGDYVKKGQLIATLVRKIESGNFEAAQGIADTAYWELQDLLTEPRKEEIRIAQAEVDKVYQKLSLLDYTLKRNKIDLADSKNEEKRYKDLEKEGAVSKRELEQKTLIRKELESSIGETEEQIHLTEDELKQAKENLKLTIEKIKKQKIEAAKGKLKTAEGGILSAQGNLENYIIKAPVSGIVTDKILHTGDIASPSSPVVRLVVPELIYLSVDVEEKELGVIKKGQRALVVFDAYPDKVFESSVKSIVEQVDPLTGTFETKLIKPGENIRLKVGMTLDATIITGKYKNIIILPTDFIIQKNGRYYVFKKAGFWAHQTLVEIENFDNNRTKITKGLKKGDIILKGIEQNKLKDNKPVKIIGYYKL